MWTGENDMNTVTCGCGSFCNRENIYAVLNLHGYVWTGPELKNMHLFSTHNCNKKNVYVFMGERDKFLHVF